MDGGEFPAPPVDVRVIRIREPRSIADPRIKAFIMRAIEAVTFCNLDPDDPAAVYGEIVENIASEGLGVFVGFNGWQCIEGQVSEPRAVAVITLPTSLLMFGPLAPIAYSENRALSLLVGKRVKEFVRKAGYNRVFGLNFWHEGGAYERVFRHVGEAELVGSVLLVKL